MAEIAISYAHEDAGLALALLRGLVDAGRSVWMDDAGIPVGAQHWKVIRQEFANAEVIVVVDTPIWREKAYSQADKKDYCQKERYFCQELGKWIVHWSAENNVAVISQIGSALRDAKDELAAHARIASRSTAGQVPVSRWQRLMIGQRAKDAELLLTGRLKHVEVTSPIRAIAEQDLRDIWSTRRFMRRAGAGVVAVLAVLAFASFAGTHLASQFAANAAESSRTARAAAMIQNSQDDVDTLRAIRSAKEADELKPNDRSRGAVDAAVLRDKRLRAMELPPGEYVGAAWAADATVVIVYTRERLQAVDTDTGWTAQPLDVEEGITGNLLVTGPDGTTATFVDDSGALAHVDLVDGTTRPLGPTGVRALAVSADGMLSWATSDSTLHIAPYPLTARLVERTAVATAAVPRAIDLDAATGQLALVDQAGWLRVYDASGDAPTEQTAVRLSESELTGASAFRASVTLCDGRIYGTFTPGIRGTAFRIIDEELVTDRAAQRTPALCTRADALSGPLARGAPDYAATDTTVVVPEELTRFLSVRDPQHQRISFLSPTPARLLIIEEETAVTRTVAGVITGVIPLTDRLLGTTDSGELIDVATGDTVGKLSGPPLTDNIAVLGCDAVLIDPVDLTHVGCRGDVTPIMPTPDDIRGVRAAADGEHFVVSLKDRVLVLDATGRQTTELAFHWLGRLATLNDADLSPDGSVLALSDILGRVHLIKLDGPGDPSTADVVGPAGNLNHIAYLPNGDLLVLGPDGIGRRYDPDLRLVDARQLGSQPTTLLVSGDRVYAAALETRVFDSETLNFVEQIVNADLVPNRLVHDQDVVGVLRVGLDTDRYTGDLIRVPRLT